MGQYEQAYKFKQIGQLQYIRHFVQFITLIFLNAKLIPVVSLASTAIIVPYLHVTQSPWSTVNGAYDSLEFSIARGFFPLVVVGVILLTAITVGRLFCGWACPFGFIQDILSYLPFKKEKLNASTISQIKDIKWVVLGFSIFSAIVVAWRRASNAGIEDSIGVFSDSPFSVISPASTLFAYIPWMLLWEPNVLATAGFFGWLKFAILILVIVPSLHVPRFFCRYLCPMGALLEPLTNFKLLRIQYTNKDRDAINQSLENICPMGVQISKDNASDYIDNPNCITCGRCLTAVPNSLSLHFAEKSL